MKACHSVAFIEVSSTLLGRAVEPYRQPILLRTKHKSRGKNLISRTIYVS